MARKSTLSLHHLVVFIFTVVLFVAIFIFGRSYLAMRSQNQYQASLSEFYTSKSISGGKVGDVIKQEKMDLSVPGLAAAYRILYITQLLNGKLGVSSGMVFIPEGKVPASGRIVLAWAHGTVGMGSACAPSRSPNPLSDMNWLTDAMKRGWVVTATDYAGLGTPGTPAYLIGESEARDVLNSIRAVQNIQEASVGNKFLLFGHSQGGHAVLFTAKLASIYAPELKLIAVAAAAPAADLVSLLSEQYNQPLAWGLAPEVSVSWPIAYPGLNLSDTLSASALKSYEALSQECLNGNINGIKFHILLGQKFYKTDPMTLSSWRNVAFEETAPFPPPKIPTIIAQGLADTVVIPNTTALYAQKACVSESNLTMMWMYGVNHIPAANTSGSYIVSWLQERLNGVPAVSTCNQPLPITPATE